MILCQKCSGIREIKIWKYIVSQHLSKSNHNTGEANINYQLSMKGVALEYFNNYNMVREANLSSTLYLYFSEDKT